MPNIELTIRTDYLPEWGTWEGVRELIQNGKDAEFEFQAPLTVTHNPSSQTLSMKNTGCTLPNEALLFGYTTKTDQGKFIGKFGEGLKLGILALIRAGHSIRIHNGAEVWVPEFINSDKFNGARVLCFSTSKTPNGENTHSVEVVIGGITRKMWKSFRSNFLFLCNAGERHYNSCGDILIDSHMRGKLFCKGILVCIVDRLRYGYNFINASVDRDRKIMNNHDLYRELTNIWAFALDEEIVKNNNGLFWKEISDNPDAKNFEPSNRLWKMFNELLQDGSFLETENIRCHVSAASNFSPRVINKLVNEFKEAHGGDSFPVANTSEVSELGHIGIVGIITKTAHRNLLQSEMGDFETFKSKNQRIVTHTYRIDELTQQEQHNLWECYNLVNSVSRFDYRSIKIVDYRTRTTNGQYFYDSREIYLARHILSNQCQLLKTYVHELAHHKSRAGDGTKAHVAEIENLMGLISIKLMGLIPGKLARTRPVWGFYHISCFLKNAVIDLYKGWKQIL